MLKITLYPLAWIPITFYCIGVLACMRNELGTMNVPMRWRDIGPGISIELITHLLERRDNWLIRFPLSRSVTGIAFLLSVFSQLARGITNTNLTPRHGTLIVSVPGHGVRQDTATFMLRQTLMDIILDAVESHVQHLQRMCKANCNPLQFGQRGTSLKQLFLMNPHILRINTLISS